jgi:hypothetical protein
MRKSLTKCMDLSTSDVRVLNKCLQLLSLFLIVQICVGKLPVDRSCLDYVFSLSIPAVKSILETINGFCIHDFLRFHR